MAQAPLKFGIKYFVQNYYFCPNFHFHFLILKFFLKFLVKTTKNIGKYLYILNIKIHNEGLSGEICRFLVFFGAWHEASVVWISEISDQPFMSFHKQIHQKHPIFDQLVKKKYFTQNFGNLASYKKGLNKIGSKMAALKGFSFGHFSKT